MIEKFNSLVPDVSDNIVPHFKVTKQSVEKQNVYDSKGKVVSTKRVRKMIASFIPADELENKGFACDLFTVENLKAAGQDPYKMQPTSQKMFGGDIDTIGSAAAALDNFDYDSLTDADFAEPAQND